MLVPGSANPLLLRTVAAAAAGGISRSLRFNSSDSAYLSRTPASAGNRKTWTWAGWVKRSALGGTQDIFNGDNSSGGTARFTGIRFVTDALYVQDALVGSYNLAWYTTAVFRDPSAWMHLVIKYDTTQASSANTVSAWVNGVAQAITFSAFQGSYLQNRDGYVNSTENHYLACRPNDSGSLANFFSGYLADIYFIDGQALDPTSFGEFSATTGVWVPKAYTGSYGTNGFRLTFADNSAATATTLGKDAAGSNNWTPNNLSVTAGAGNDSLVDVPTNGSQTDTGAGGEVRGNYCVLNPLDTGSITLANGNLDATFSSGSGWNTSRSTIWVSSGKWYWETTIGTVTSGQPVTVGVCQSSLATSSYIGGNSTSYGYYAGGKRNNGSDTAYGASFTSGDVIGTALDLDAGTITFYKNGSSQGQAFSGLSGTFAPAISLYVGQTSSATVMNFGQRPFAYTAPSGFKALCTANLPAPLVTKPNTVMDVLLYTGNGSTQTISGLGFNPDFVWIKARNQAYGHALMDAVRGASQRLFSETTDQEDSVASLTSFNSDGFSVSTVSNLTARTNWSSTTYAAWAWDAGSSTVTNTQGSISSQVRANATAGFSVVTYTGNGNSASTVGHGLGVAPPLVIAKSRSTSDSWVVYTNIIDGSNDYLLLNSTAAKVNSSHSSPTSTVFNPSLTIGPSVTCVAYCFAPVVGYSSFGSYTGNGSTDGPFVFTGMRPRWVMVKRTDSTADWQVFDAARNTYNALTSVLFPNAADAEASNSVYAFDFISNGFKVRSSQTQFNASGGTYIYAAFAESPFNYARAR